MTKALSDDPFKIEWRSGETLDAMLRETALHARKLLEDIWKAIDQVEEYEGRNAIDYLEELPLGVVWEMGEPFTVVLSTGGPHIEITGGGRSFRYALTVEWGGEKATVHGGTIVYWGGNKATVHGDAIDRTGAYFRYMYENK